uniref:Uncharacterized protein n=1 Tax=Candidozyma auris TaxID=498019 RepID=A0A0L0NYQ1_CANAR
MWSLLLVTQPWHSKWSILMEQDLTTYIYHTLRTRYGFKQMKIANILQLVQNLGGNYN